MGMKTGIIKFNVKDRGRRFRGQERAFDTAALATLINGGSVQERVKMRDMLGYYGHWPRVKFGMNPAEGGIVGGKQVSLEPALVTTYLKAYPDGTIEHESEFLDTAAGRLAERLFKSKAGGFSSAIDARNVGGKQLATGMYGFDYVLEPNYTGNRGHSVLDGVDGETVALLDEAGEYGALIESTNHILDQIQGDYDRLLESFKRVTEENEVMAGMLAKQEKAAPVLDSLVNVVYGETRSRFDSAADFEHAHLEGYEQPDNKGDEKPKAAKAAKTAADDHLERRFGKR